MLYRIQYYLSTNLSKELGIASKSECKQPVQLFEVEV